MSIFHDHLVTRINAIETEIKEVKDEIKEVKDEIKAVEKKIDSCAKELKAAEDAVKQTPSKRETPQTAEMHDFYIVEVKRLEAAKMFLQEDEKFLREDEMFLREKKIYLRKEEKSLQKRKMVLQERLHHKEAEKHVRMMSRATLNQTETTAILTRNKRRTRIDDKTDAQDDMSNTCLGSDNNITSQGSGDNDKHASAAVARASERPDVGNVSRVGTGKSNKGKSEQPQSKPVQRDSDNWAARMKVLDTGEDVANELDLLDMLEDEQDRKDIVESVMFRRLVMPMFPGIDKIGDDEPPDDGCLVLSAANLELHLRSLGQESNTNRWLSKSSELGRSFSS